MKKVEDSSASNNAAGDGWFKIYYSDYDTSVGKWCTEKLILNNNGHLAATIPKDLAPGYYLVRPELLTLHNADNSPPDPQFYIGCAQIFLSSSGSANPSNTVAIPGYVDMDNPAMNFNIYKQPMDLPFPSYGPPLYTAGSSKRDLKVRELVQTIGLKPAGCVIENANWCGFMPPSYTDEKTCYEVSSASGRCPLPLC